MKQLLLILSLFVLIACSDSPVSDKTKLHSIEKEQAAHKPRPQVPQIINYDSLNSSVRNEIKTLDSLYGRTPYYAIFQNKKMFVVMKGKFETYADYSTMFTGRFKYGLANESLKIILPFNYDKIYNPNLTVLNCMEIKKAGKTGLFNFSTSEILEPEFDYIVPSSAIPGNVAYGFKNENWYKIESLQKFKTSKVSFSPVELLKTLSFNVHDVKENLFYGSYNMEADGPADGLGVVLTPSYIEHWNIIPEICEDLILPEQKESDFGTAEMNVKTDTVRSITDKIISFVVSFYRQGVDGRGFVEDSKQVIVYNKEKNSFNTGNLNSKYDGYDNFCQTQGYKFINDTLIEVLQRTKTDSLKESRYDFENAYSYKLITKDGEIVSLYSNRYYNFTKYFEINESYLGGCYAKWMKDDEKKNDDYQNVWVSEHLTLEDMDLMVNEIYAEYGLKFKSAKWQDYFSKFSWYKPQHDNVDKMLNKIDKKNIETIAREKNKMKGKENDYVKKHKSAYSAAG